MLCGKIAQTETIGKIKSDGCRLEEPRKNPMVIS
jgi:hypothetical protein